MCNIFQVLQRQSRKPKNNAHLWMLQEKCSEQHISGFAETQPEYLQNVNVSFNKSVVKCTRFSVFLVLIQRSQSHGPKKNNALLWMFYQQSAANCTGISVFQVLQNVSGITLLQKPMHLCGCFILKSTAKRTGFNIFQVLQKCGLNCVPTKCTLMNVSL